MALSALAIAALVAAAMREVGGIGGAVSETRAAKGILSPEEEAKLAELKNLQSSGSLGLQGDALKALQLNALAPLRAGDREAQQQLGAAYGASGAGPADLARALQGTATQRAERYQPAMGVIASAQEAERKLQEQQILTLGQEQEDEKRALQQARIGIILASLGATGRAVERYTAAKAGGDVATSAAGGTPSSASEAEDLMTDLY